MFPFVSCPSQIKYNKILTNLREKATQCPVGLGVKAQSSLESVRNLLNVIPNLFNPSVPVISVLSNINKGIKF